MGKKCGWDLSAEVMRPAEMLRNALNREVKVVLKNDVEYVGKLVEVDVHMNLVLSEVDEYHNGNKRASYPYLLIRGNNVVYIALKEPI
jgi:small nuclear ribonucleoprotein